MEPEQPRENIFPRIENVFAAKDQRFDNGREGGATELQQRFKCHRLTYSNDNALLLEFWLFTFYNNDFFPDFKKEEKKH